MTMMSQLHHLFTRDSVSGCSFTCFKSPSQGTTQLLCSTAEWGAFGPSLQALALAIHDSMYHPIPTQDGNYSTCMNTRKNSLVFRSLMKMGNSQNHGICLLERGASWYPRGGASWHSKRGGAPYGIQGEEHHGEGLSAPMTDVHS